MTDVKYWLTMLGKQKHPSLIWETLILIQILESTASISYLIGYGELIRQVT